jgi:hypothetical protein
MFIIIIIKISIKFPFRLLFDGKDDKSYDPVAQSSLTYSFSNDDHQKVSIGRNKIVCFKYFDID